MNAAKKPDDETRERGKAQHGARSDVNWEGGSGRQPYANRGRQEGEEPSWPVDEVSEGDRGDRSGRNAEQVDQSRKVP